MSVTVISRFSLQHRLSSIWGLEEPQPFFVRFYILPPVIVYCGLTVSVKSMIGSLRIYGSPHLQYLVYFATMNTPSMRSASI